MKISYNWLKWYVPDAPKAEELADVLTYHLAEVERLDKLPDGDYILDIKILPNRGHDLLSHQGVAREVASLLNIPFVDPTPKYNRWAFTRMDGKTFGIKSPAFNKQYRGSYQYSYL